MMWLPLTAIAVVMLALGLWWDRRPRRRVRPVPAADVTPEAIRYVSLRQDDGR
ncbi:hypothetical protein [Kitasatospora sp. A2-31]|uniref:hypothetical protein n=1 Tax=Kitasatospora sp. A2-31 TaxID=2916414 RepID=UPI001EE82E22|nr:hypothetical protein [Kitasatospora sp. A2-31]MCG6493386.1 hypothetical protein [Kitasatospora sp. A2-31]